MIDENVVGLFHLFDEHPLKCEDLLVGNWFNLIIFKLFHLGAMFTQTQHLDSDNVI